METRNWSKELRLGNYVMDSPIHGDEPLEVEAIYSNLVIHGERHVYNDEIRPIPLTEEWLLKFGFKAAKNIIPIYDLGLISIYLESDSYPEGRVYFNSWCIIKKKPKYLHQLQNLYHSLCGEELEINLTQE